MASMLSVTTIWKETAGMPVRTVCGAVPVRTSSFAPAAATAGPAPRGGVARGQPRSCRAAGPPSGCRAGSTGGFRRYSSGPLPRGNGEAMAHGRSMELLE